MIRSVGHCQREIHYVSEEVAYTGQCIHRSHWFTDRRLQLSTTVLP